METTEALAMAADNPHFPAWLRTACKDGAAEIDRRFGIGAELLIARRERDELLDKLTVKNLGLMHAISTLERGGDEWAVCESLRAAYKA